MEPKKTNAIAKRKEEKRALMFAGSSNLLGQPKDKKEQMERKIIMLTANALAISPFGVNILGSLPYINNKGLKEKMSGYHTDAQFEYDWVQYAKDDAEKAICKARVVRGSKALSGWVIGECSPKTMKMGTLQGYQNHMAQTRAENRAMEAAIGTRMRKELFENIAKLLQSGGTTEDLAQKVITAGNTSAEEATMMHAARPAADDTYAKAINAIMNENSLPKLEEYKKKIATSKIYTVEQKGQLNSFIDDRIAFKKSAPAA